MMAYRHSKTALGLIIAGAAVSSVLLIGAAAGTVPVGEEMSLQTASTTDAAASCGQQAISPDGVCTQSCETAPPAADADRKPPGRGYCQCSCGAPCRSSADCGGAACRPFITCC